MLTIEKVNIYKKYGGSSDGYEMLNRDKALKIISGEEWALIDSLVQDILLTNKNLVDKSFADRLNQRLKDCCDNEETIIAIKNI